MELEYRNHATKNMSLTILSTFFSSFFIFFLSFFLLMFLLKRKPQSYQTKNKIKITEANFFLKKKVGGMTTIIVRVYI